MVPDILFIHFHCRFHLALPSRTVTDEATR